MKVIDKILNDLEDSITYSQYSRIENENVELKDNSHSGGSWDKLMETVCAFLNTDSGIIVIGVNEDVTNKKYEIKGFNFDNENALKDSIKKITDENGHSKEVSNYIHFEQRELLGKHLMVVFVESLPADEKYVYYKGVAYERVMSGDVRIPKIKIESQDEYRQEYRDAREMKPVPNSSIDDLDVDKLNAYIQLANAETKFQNIIPSIKEAIPFLTRNGMLRENTPTILGMLVCGKTPFDFLHWRSQVDAYVDMPADLPINKKVMNDNILPLLEKSYAFVFRNIQTGISVEKGGTKTFEYPDALIRESINNSLAHRDYTINQFVNINIVPSKHIQIKNPGRFKKQLLIIDEKHEIPIRRIVPNPKANNPKLARVLSVYDKYEGKGRGMKNLVSASLDGYIDLPYYIFHSWDDLSLFIPKGDLVDEPMESLFDSYSKYIALKLNGNELSDEQKRVFAYFYKSEIENRNHRYTLQLTQDNNHLQAINTLVKSGLIEKHPISDEINAVYITDRTFFKDNFFTELRLLFGGAFDGLPPDYKEVLSSVYLFKNFSLKHKINANVIGNQLFLKLKKTDFELKEYEAFKRKVRKLFNNLEEKGFLIAVKAESKKGRNITVDYEINVSFKRTTSLFDL